MNQCRLAALSLSINAIDSDDADEKKSEGFVCVSLNESKREKCETNERAHYIFIAYCVCGTELAISSRCMLSLCRVRSFNIHCRRHPRHFSRSRAPHNAIFHSIRWTSYLTFLIFYLTCDDTTMTRKKKKLSLFIIINVIWQSLLCVLGMDFCSIVYSSISVFSIFVKLFRSKSVSSSPILPPIHHIATK